jgi:hypothetical protein
MDVDNKVGGFVRRAGYETRVDESLQPGSAVMAVELDDRVAGRQALDPHDFYR